jgi:hypothetical protein
MRCESCDCSAAERDCRGRQGGAARAIALTSMSSSWAPTPFAVNCSASPEGHSNDRITPLETSCRPAVGASKRPHGSADVAARRDRRGP